MPTPEKQRAFLEKAYFAASDNPHDDVNPFLELGAFLQARVGDLRWGDSNEVRDRSKYAFADNFIRILGLYRVALELQAVQDGVADDTRQNAEVVSTWLQQARFQP